MEKCSLLHFHPAGRERLHPHCPQAYPQLHCPQTLDFRHSPGFIHIFHRFSTSAIHSLSSGGCVLFAAVSAGFRRGFVLPFSKPVRNNSRICMIFGPGIVPCGAFWPLGSHGSSACGPDCRTSVRIIRRKSYPQAQKRPASLRKQAIHGTISARWSDSGSGRPPSSPGGRSRPGPGWRC